MGFEGLYEVSNLGSVRSKDRTVIRNNGYPLSLKGRLLPQYKKCGNSDIPRLFVNFSKEGKQYTKSVHRLVAMAFIPNPLNLPQINHKDENPLNNCVDNLEWCDNEYNHNYGTRNIRQAEKLTKKVAIYDLHMNFLSICGSILEASKLYNCDPSSITKVCKGKYKHHKNYIFKYI